MDLEWTRWALQPESQASGTFVVNGSVVMDAVTGLTWERDVSASTFTADEAFAYCPTSTTGGLRGWRLPTVIELESLVDYGRHGPAIDTSAFPTGPSDRFWTSTRRLNSSVHAWYVDFTNGQAWYTWTGSFRARCVQ